MQFISFKLIYAFVEWLGDRESKGKVAAVEEDELAGHGSGCGDR